MKRFTSIFVIAIAAFGACGSPVGPTRVDAPAAATSRAPTLPDLTDPAVRHRFVCSFAPGYFTNPPLASPVVDPDCDDV
jgi:hypothetical protein